MVNQKQNRNSVNPDETAHYELSHLDLHCLQKYLSWYAGLKGNKHQPLACMANSAEDKLIIFF